MWRHPASAQAGKKNSSLGNDQTQQLHPLLINLKMLSHCVCHVRGRFSRTSRFLALSWLPPPSPFLFCLGVTWWSDFWGNKGYSWKAQGTIKGGRDGTGVDWCKTKALHTVLLSGDTTTPSTYTHICLSVYLLLPIFCSLLVLFIPLHLTQLGSGGCLDCLTNWEVKGQRFLPTKNKVLLRHSTYLH